MLKLGKTIVKYRIPILILSLLMLIPSGLTYLNTRINYDILSYLPKDIDTMKGQDILVDEFGTGAFSICVVENMGRSDLAKLEKRVSEVPHVKAVLGMDAFRDMNIPVEALPQELAAKFNNTEKNSTLFMILFDTSSSSDETLDGIEQIRRLAKGQCFMSGMSSVIEDIKNVCRTESVMYVTIAALLTIVVLSLTMDSFLIPIFFLISIGMAIVYNLGTNFISGEISFITQALAAVLQLAVTLDYSIFLWHSYQEYREKYQEDKERAMAHAISNTIVSVVGSSITTIAGFVAMCFMTFTLGVDLGIVMAKGVLFGVLGCVTILPSMILVFDGAIQKTRHKPIIPDLGRIGRFVTNKYLLFVIIFAAIMGPAIYGYRHNTVYYDLVGTLPKDLESATANSKLENDYSMGVTHMILADSGMTAKHTSMMLGEIEKLPGVKIAVGLDNLIGPTIPKDIIPAQYRELLDNGHYKQMLVVSEYKNASDEVNDQVEQIQTIIKKYDPSAMLIGEAPCTRDLIKITDKDFKTVSAVSILLIFVIILFVLKSITLPVILVAVIESAIFINMGIPAYTHTTLPFIASIVIGTIQLGATVDYAILMTNKYKKLRHGGTEKKEAVVGALNGSLQSVFVSALSFFAATFGVGMYSSIDMISSLCILLARGAIISFIMVAFVLPAMFMIFDGLIIRTSIGFRPEQMKTNGNLKNA